MNSLHINKILKDVVDLFKIVNIISWILLSLCVTLLMAYITNGRIMSTVSSDGIDSDSVLIKKYKFNTRSIAFLIIIMLLTGISAFVVSQHVVSIIACIELGICYLAVLGAAIIDIKLRIIPNFIPIFLVISRIVILIYELIFTNQAISYLVSSLIGCFLCFIVLIIAEKVSKGGIGKGDIKLLSAIGFVGGIYTVSSTLLAALLACIVLALILFGLKKGDSKVHLPFGPFIYFGYLIVLLCTLY